MATKYKKAVLSHGEPHDAAIKFDTNRFLQWHHAVSLPHQSILFRLCLQTADNVGLLCKVSKQVAKEKPQKCCRLTPPC